jgi:hypothetical protein
MNSVWTFCPHTITVGLLWHPCTAPSVQCPLRHWAKQEQQPLYSMQLRQRASKKKWVSKCSGGKSARISCFRTAIPFWSFLEWMAPHFFLEALCRSCIEYVQGLLFLLSPMTKWTFSTWGCAGVPQQTHCYCAMYSLRFAQTLLYL